MDILAEEGGCGGCGSHWVSAMRAGDIAAQVVPPDAHAGSGLLGMMLRWETRTPHAHRVGGRCLGKLTMRAAISASPHAHHVGGGRLGMLAVGWLAPPLCRSRCHGR